MCKRILVLIGPVILSVISFGGGIAGAIEAKRFHGRCLEAKGSSKVE